MNLRALTVFLWGCLVATAAVAGEEHETKIVIKTDDGKGDFEWVSNDPNADFSKLEVGESKTITSKSGKEITVTRNEEGFEFDVEGKKIEMMHFGEHGDDMMIDVDVLHDGEGKVHKIHKVHKGGDVVIDGTKNIQIIKSDAKDGVTIISSSELDDETRAKIEAALEEAGKEGDVMFLDGSELHGDDVKVHVIKKEKKVEVKVDVEEEQD